MKRQDLRERMDRIQKCIETLTSFAERAEKLDHEPPRQQCTVRFSAPLESIRINASRVHDVLLSRWCKSHTPHRAAILLEDRMLRRKRGRRSAREGSKQKGTADRFALCLDEHLPTARWLSTEFRITEELSKRYLYLRIYICEILEANNRYLKNSKQSRYYGYIHFCPNQHHPLLKSITA